MEKFFSWAFDPDIDKSPLRIKHSFSFLPTLPNLFIPGMAPKGATMPPGSELTSHLPEGIREAIQFCTQHLPEQTQFVGFRTKEGHEHAKYEPLFGPPDWDKKPESKASGEGSEQPQSDGPKSGSYLSCSCPSFIRKPTN